MAQNGMAERSNAAVYNDQGGTMCPAAHAASADYASTLAKTFSAKAGAKTPSTYTCSPKPP